MKIAYLILAHSNPRLLKRAIQTLSLEESGFFLHIDRKVDIRQFSEIDAKNVFFCEPRIPIHWGEFSIVQATLQLIGAALDHAMHYDYFVLLSGSDYPLRSGKYIQEFLESRRGHQFMNLARMPARGYPLSTINKIRYPSHKPIRRFLSRALARIGLAQRNFKKHFPELEPSCGSQWWAISREAAEYIRKFVNTHPRIERYFRNTFTADEMFFHTILGNSPLNDQIRRNLVYIDWPTPGDHPLVLGEKHIELFDKDEMVWMDDEWGTGEALFARKFGEDRLDLLDRIDEMIRRKERSVAGRS